MYMVCCQRNLQSSTQEWLTVLPDLVAEFRVYQFNYLHRRIKISCNLCIYGFIFSCEFRRLSVKNYFAKSLGSYLLRGVAFVHIVPDSGELLLLMYAMGSILAMGKRGVAKDYSFS